MRGDKISVNSIFAKAPSSFFVIERLINNQNFREKLRINTSPSCFVKNIYNDAKCEMKPFDDFHSSYMVPGESSRIFLLECSDN